MNCKVVGEVKLSSAAYRRIKQLEKQKRERDIRDRKDLGENPFKKVFKK